MTPCKKCGLPMQWTKVAGRWFGNNPDGTSHWTLCAEARNARIKREGVPFKDAEGDGFIFEGKKHYFVKVAYTKFGKPVQQKEFKT